jgi:hypothetical protein
LEGLFLYVGSVTHFRFYWQNPALLFRLKRSGMDWTFWQEVPSLFLQEIASIPESLA